MYNSKSSILKKVYYIIIDINAFFINLLFPFMNGEYFYISKKWRHRFGIRLCIDLKHAMKKDKNKDFYITRINCNTNSLSIFSNNISQRVLDVIVYYNTLSLLYCQHCGHHMKQYAIVKIHDMNLDCIFCSFCNEHIHDRFYERRDHKIVDVTIDNFKKVYDKNIIDDASPEMQKRINKLIAKKYK